MLGPSRVFLSVPRGPLTDYEVVCRSQSRDFSFRGAHFRAVPEPLVHVPGPEALEGPEGRDVPPPPSEDIALHALKLYTALTP